MRLLQLQHPGSANHLSLNQSLPPCQTCHSTHAFVIGTHDFSFEVEKSRIALDVSRGERARAAVTLQTYLRAYNLKQKYTLHKKSVKDNTKTRRDAVVCLQVKFMRAYLGRKRFAVIHSLARIRNAHASVLHRALNEDFDDNVKVFWYSRQAELAVLFRDYEVFVRRTGGRPPKRKVEANIHEVRRRVHLLECEYATRIQSRWRGVIGRKFSVRTGVVFVACYFVHFVRFVFLIPLLT